MTDRAHNFDDRAVWSEVLRLIIDTGRWLEVLISDKAIVHEAMCKLLDALPRDPDQDLAGKTWQESWEELGNEVPYTLYGPTVYIRELNDFAFLGTSLDAVISDPGTSFGERAAAIEQLISTCQAVVAWIPKEWDSGDAPAIRKSILAAEARIRLDTRRDVSPEQLAAIAGVSPKSIRNLMTPKSGIDALRTKGGLILNEDAFRWLRARQTFQPSRWIEPDPVFGPEVTSAGDVGEVLFVPAARDGSWFDPVTCRQDKGFIIGPKKSEILFEDYFEALDRLARMPTPYWRHTNPSGRLAVVAGVSWLRKPYSEIAASKGVRKS